MVAALASTYNPSFPERSQYPGGSCCHMQVDIQTAWSSSSCVREGVLAIAGMSLWQNNSSISSISHSLVPGIKRSCTRRSSRPSMIGVESLRLSSSFNQVSCHMLMELPSLILRLQPCLRMNYDDHILFQI